ncbi:MAG: cytochrome b N-terminal domain-containing protein [Acidobacteria bacterium]|nr:cytochrome b N-terminal domain-containing protein [Acidobacteriota bacterium]
MRWYKTLYGWIERRIQLESPIKDVVLHPVPKSTASWWYVFGSASLTLLILQVLTGIFLAITYVPSAADAWQSLQVLNHQLPLGWFLRAMHGWGSNFMVAVVLVHMVQVFVFGAYKFPRELTWIVGVFLLVLTLGMAFTGQVLRFDQDAYWGVGIGAAITGRVPLIGRPLVQLLLGGPIIAGATLTRFFTLHVFVIPGILLALVALHVWMVLKLGINEWPMPGRLVRRSTYIEEYNELARKSDMPFVPGAIWKDLAFGGALLAAVAVCAIALGPIGPGGPPDPTLIQTVPKPDYFFLWIYAGLALLPAAWETPVILGAPVVILLVLIALPLIAGEGEKSWRRRPFAVLLLTATALGLAVLTHLGTYHPWSPKMNAWSSDPVPVRYLHDITPLERQGAIVLQEKQCRNCHSLDGEGGRRGPALDDVATRLTYDQFVRQVVQGGGNMPAYGKNLSGAEVDALVGFLETLHPAGQPPASDMSRALQQSETVPNAVH